MVIFFYNNTDINYLGPNPISKKQIKISRTWHTEFIFCNYNHLCVDGNDPDLWLKIPYTVWLES